jgi:hypothetical protein
MGKPDSSYIRLANWKNKLYTSSAGIIFDFGDPTMTHRKFLGAAAAIVVGVRFAFAAAPAAAPSKPADVWPKIVALAKKAPECKDADTSSPPPVKRLCRQTKETQPGITIYHKLSFATYPDGKDQVAIIYARTSSSKAAFWFFVYDSSGTAIKNYKTGVRFDAKGNPSPQQEMSMAADESARISDQEKQYWVQKK